MIEEKSIISLIMASWFNLLPVLVWYLLYEGYLSVLLSKMPTNIPSSNKKNDGKNIESKDNLIKKPIKKSSYKKNFIYLLKERVYLAVSLVVISIPGILCVDVEGIEWFLTILMVISVLILLFAYRVYFLSIIVVKGFYIFFIILNAVFMMVILKVSLEINKDIATLFVKSLPYIGFNVILAIWLVYLEKYPLSKVFMNGKALDVDPDIRNDIIAEAMLDVMDD